MCVKWLVWALFLFFFLNLRVFSANCWFSAFFFCFINLSSNFTPQVPQVTECARKMIEKIHYSFPPSSIDYHLREDIKVVCWGGGSSHHQHHHYHHYHYHHHHHHHHLALLPQWNRRLCLAYSLHHQNGTIDEYVRHCAECYHFEGGRTGGRGEYFWRYCWCV